MEDKTVLPFAMELQLWDVVSVEGARRIHRDEEGKFRFETLTFTVTNEAGCVLNDHLRFYSYQEGTFTRIPVTSTE